MTAVFVGTARPKLFWQVYFGCLFVSFLTLAAVSFYALRSEPDDEVIRVNESLMAQALLVEEGVQLGLMALPSPDIDAYCKRIQAKAGTRVTIMGPDGIVLGDSNANPDDMGSHWDRPEVQLALENGEGTAQRYSSTLQREMCYLAVPVVQDGEVTAIVRVAVPLLGLRENVAENRKNMILVGLLTGLLAAVVSAWISRRVVRPLWIASSGVQRFSQGDFSHRMEIPEQKEVADLVLRLNQMAEALEQRMRTIREQGAEESAILEGMVEGVLAVGPDERLLKVNHAAAKLLQIDPGEAEGRPVQEILRQADFLAYIQHLRQAGVGGRRDVLLQGAEDRVLEVHGSKLVNDDGKLAGVIVVMHDVTRLRRLQRVRSEFVANVSHELKSPITSILGFAETLKDGAMAKPDEARRFLDIIERQASRMYNIVNDLLQLSRIEDSSSRGEVTRQNASIRPILDAAVQQCEGRRQQRSVQVEVQCDPSIEAQVNPPLLEQAVVNLIDNAVKHSDANTGVLIRAEWVEDELVISVADEGRGIPQEHIPRLFERFYRVDKARSQDVGGTGLGLSIVKHIVQAHEGTVSATSTFGKGSTFTIRFPMPGTADDPSSGA